MTKLEAVIYDTGPVGSNIASRWYSMEHQVVSGYFNICKNVLTGRAYENE